MAEPMPAHAGHAGVLVLNQIAPAGLARVQPGGAARSGGGSLVRPLAMP